MIRYAVETEGREASRINLDHRLAQISAPHIA
ncbi:hypothetical protein M2171_002646 [Bradyrhizobium japonicum USDA 38]|nr:hypothetical protein [Bradyrhizobium japonicum USDA 38]MCS3946027.1 hypothetical protein [Bradyrhizobium japonicum]